MELVAELVADNQATDFGTGVTKPTGLTSPTGNGPFGFAAALLFTPDIAQQARRDRSWMNRLSDNTLLIQTLLEWTPVMNHTQSQ